MQHQTIFLKGMVCNRCIIMVESELKVMGHTPVKLSLGEVSYILNETSDPRAIEERLSLLGFAFLEDKKIELTRKVKNLLKTIYNGDFDFPKKFRFANLIEQTIQKDYDYISNAFISTEKKTIEQYVIEYRINKIKEYLVYTNHTLADIAFKLNFNSVAHLSTQFKQQTGLPPSFFKKIKNRKSEVVFSKN